MPDTDQLTEVLTVQLTSIVQAPLIEIARCFQDNQSDDGEWDSCAITEAIWPILQRLGVGVRCDACDYDFAWTPQHMPGLEDCPNWDAHICSCGNRNDECTCEDCSECGCYDCECPICDNCNCTTSNCGCDEADRMWPADA